jgi:hypothetical protein
MITGQAHGVLRVSQADAARLDTKPATQKRVSSGDRSCPSRVECSPSRVSPEEGLAGFVLAFTKSGYHSHKRLLGLHVRVLLKTLGREAERKSMQGRVVSQARRASQHDRGSSNPPCAWLAGDCSQAMRCVCGARHFGFFALQSPILFFFFS